MNFDLIIVRSSAFLASMLYFATLIVRRAGEGQTHWLQVARVIWTMGCLTLLAHVALAFGLIHHWSHTDAYVATAKQTAELVGLDWGGGIYANYAFAVVWLADVIWWWRGTNRYLSRPMVVEWFVQGFLAFMVFNATVVFGHGGIRWFGLGGFLVLAAIAAWAPPK